jgi:hypothetical protein
MAAARANGSHAATEAMLGAIVNGPQDEEQKVEKYTFSDKSFEHFYSVMRHTESWQCAAHTDFLKISSQWAEILSETLVSLCNHPG